jgi:hypothetical protein
VEVTEEHILKKKFLNFVMHLQERTAMRTWYGNVFGLGGDPRLAKLLEIER